VESIVVEGRPVVALEFEWHVGAGRYSGLKREQRPTRRQRRSPP
jgi:hypothetical protein